MVCCAVVRDVSVWAKLEAAVIWLDFWLFESNAWGLGKDNFSFELLVSAVLEVEACPSCVVLALSVVWGMLVSGAKVGSAPVIP